MDSGDAQLLILELPALRRTVAAAALYEAKPQSGEARSTLLAALQPQPLPPKIS